MRCIIGQLTAKQLLHSSLLHSERLPPQCQCIMYNPLHGCKDLIDLIEAIDWTGEFDHALDHERPSETEFSAHAGQILTEYRGVLYECTFSLVTQSCYNR